MQMQQNEIFQHKINVINAYLDVLTANELVKVYEENLKRTETNLSLVNTLVINGIKPGVDSALLKAEASKAKIELLNSQKIQRAGNYLLSQFLASDTTIAFSDTAVISANFRLSIMQLIQSKIHCFHYILHPLI